MNYSWVTLVATNDFIDGAINLYNSLQEVNSKYPLLVMVTNNILKENLAKLDELNIPYLKFPYLSFRGYPPIEDKSWEHTEEEKGCIYWDCTLSKFYVLTLTEYDKVIFVDADVEFLKNCDHYFDYETPAGIYPPWEEEKNMFGAVFSITPSLEDFMICIEIAMDNDFINDEQVLRKWNSDFANKPNQMFPQSDIWTDDDSKLKILHHDGPIKPWMKSKINGA